MLIQICPKYCPSPFCMEVCPPAAISVSEKDGCVYLDTDLCNRCTLCRVACTAMSRDKNLQRKRPWVSRGAAEPVAA